MDCVHLLFSTLRLSHRFVTANHRQLSLLFSAWKSLEKVFVYKAASGKSVSRLASDWSWSHLNWTSSVIGGGPVMEDEGNLTVQNLSGRQPLDSLGFFTKKCVKFMTMLRKIFNKRIM